VKKELAVAADAAADLGTPVVLWSLLVGELVINSLLLLSDKLPPVLFRSLQLFLRF
jgi:hypothetical protein